MNRQSGRQRQTACGRPFFLCPLVVVSAGRQVAVMLRTIWLYGTGKKCLLETLQSRISTFTCRCVSLQKCQRILHCLIIKSFIPIFHYKSRPSRIKTDNAEEWRKIDCFQENACFSRHPFFMLTKVHLNLTILAFIDCLRTRI